MENKIFENADIKEGLKKGLDMTFKKLLKEKIQSDGILVFSQNGIIKKVRAKDRIK